MTTITILPGQLVQIGCTQANETLYIDALNAACAQYNINTVLRLSAFIAQIFTESARLTAVQENLNYSAARLLVVFPTHFSGAADAANYGGQPQKIANRVYANRMGNGSEASGDGWSYFGRGCIQLTGKSNYNACSQGVGVNFIGNPSQLATPQYAALSAAWFWNSKSLNDYADRSDFTSITQRINGGQNGAATRVAFYQKALIVFGNGATTEPVTPPTNPPTTTIAPASTAPITSKQSPSATNNTIGESSGGKPIYPWNMVFQSRSGHITEIDDTPGVERLNNSHRTGSYWEIGPLGTYTMKSVLDMYLIAKGDSYYYTGGSVTEQIQGQSYRYSAGDYVIKSDGNIFLDASRVQVNAGMLAVSGEINSPNINADVFTGPFANVLAATAMLAWDIGSGGGGGSAPAMINGSLGFMGNAGTALLLTNTLSSKKPNGAAIITNGIPLGAVVDPTSATSTVASTTAVGPANVVGVSIAAGNAITSAAAAIDAANVAAGNNTPVFVKHVSFDKPTLLSQSTVAALPDPSLYTNNLHTIVDATSGTGELYISDGTTWNPTGSGAAATAAVVAIVNSTVGTATNDALVASQVAAAAALSAAALTAANNLAEQSAAQQAALTAGLLADAANWGTAISAESVIRADADSTLSEHILTLSATVDGNTTAIQQEQTARADGDSANAQSIETLAGVVDGNTTSITNNATTAANATSAVALDLTNLTTTVGTNLATLVNDYSTTTTTNTAIATAVNGLASTVAGNLASTISNYSTTATVNSAIATAVNALSSTVAGNLASTISAYSTTASMNSAIATAVNALGSTVSGNQAYIVANYSTTATTNTAISNAINTLSSTVAGNLASTISNYSTTATTNSAIATAVNTLSTTVGSTYATLTTVASINTSVGVVNANYGVSINANGAVTGFNLLNTSTGGTSFKIQANSLQLVNSSGGAAGTPFSVDSSGNLTITGALNAATGTFAGSLSAASGTFSGAVSGGSGYPVGHGFAWPTNGGTGFYLDPNGLLLGNYNTGQYLELTASGQLYAPGFSISGGTATFSGNISGASGTFAGNLSAGGVITTGNVAGNAITQIAAASSGVTGGGNYIGVTISCSGGPVQILGYGTGSSTTNANIVLYRGSPSGAALASSNNGTGSSAIPSCSVMYLDNPGSGNITYYLLNSYAANSSFLSVMELKR